MDSEREQSIENISNLSLKSANHTDPEKCPNISINENEPRGKRENSILEDRISQKSEQIGYLKKEKPHSVSINIPLEKKSPRNKRLPNKKRYFCCGSLADGAIASANYSNVISVIIIIASSHLFFRTSRDDEGIIKAFSFIAVIYAICYIRSSTNLKRAIAEELREKIIPWILFTMLTIFFLLSAAVYVSVTYWEELDDFDEDLTTPCLRLILIPFLAFVGCTLIYCVYGVVRLFQSMALVQTPGFSLMNDIRSFVNGVSV